MSGHSKWSQIKHKKGITDAKKGKIFSRLSKLITIAARKGTDPKGNVSLSQAIERAREANMPLDNIQRAIKKISEKGTEQLEELSIEAIGPGGVALKIKAITDSRNRTIAEIKKILSENNSKMVPPGSITWMFGQPMAQPEQSVQNQIDRLFNSLDEQDDVEDVESNLQE
jgi:YebC/PmpR family DNA-binding regulatory protein